MAVELVPDELWQEIEPLLPPRPAYSPKGDGGRVGRLPAAVLRGPTASREL